MKRKLLSAALIGAMLVTSVPAFAANENTGGTSLPFTDVADGAWYYDSVVYAYDKGLMTGTSATEFAPDVTMTRGMIASVLYRLEGNPAMSDGNLGYPYEDVEGDDWYAMPIYWARQNGIMNGYSQTTFARTTPSPANSSQPPSTTTPRIKAATFPRVPISANTPMPQASAAGQKTFSPGPMPKALSMA